MLKIVVKKKKGVFVFSADEVVYMEKKLRKIGIHTMCKDREYMEFYGKFNEIMPYLDGRFMCCHRSYIINMDNIIWMSGCDIFVATNETIHMGRDAYNRARKIFTDYLNKKYPDRKCSRRMWR